MNLTNLIIVESSGNDLAIGALQIHRGVVLDVNRITGSHYRHQDMTRTRWIVSVGWSKTQPSALDP